MLEFCTEPTDHEEIWGVFCNGHHREPTYKHSLYWILMATFPLVTGPLRENRNQEVEDEEDSRPVDSESKRSIGRVCSL